MANYTGTDWQPETKISTDIMATIDEGLGEVNADLTDNYNYKTYSTLAQIGLSNGVTVIDIVNQMRNNGYLTSIFIGSYSASSVTDLPGSGAGMLYIVVGTSANSRYDIVEFTSHNSDSVKYIGKIASGFGSITWYEVGLTAVNTTALKNDEYEPI